MNRRIGETLQVVREHGVREAYERIATTLSERWHERRLGIRTGGNVALHEIGRTDATCHDYMPIAFRSFNAAMKRLEIRAGEDVFVDYGAGKGRVVAMAGMRPFRRVIGVELAEELATIGRENLRIVGPRLICPDVQILTEDATQFRLPDDATVLHFYNPFRGKILDAVMSEIERSFRASPRRGAILFANPGHFQELMRSRGWELAHEDVQWPGFPRVDPDSNRYRIYRIVP